MTFNLVAPFTHSGTILELIDCLLLFHVDLLFPFPIPLAFAFNCRCDYLLSWELKLSVLTRLYQLSFSIILYCFFAADNVMLIMLLINHSLTHL